MNFSRPSFPDSAASALKAFSRSQTAWTNISFARRASRLAVPFGAATFLLMSRDVMA